MAPPSCYATLPLCRRAAVLILLFADPRGDLRVVLTLRASTLKSYPGQAAFPGGKADTLAETAVQTARREAREEIGLPSDDGQLQPPFRIEHLCELPTNLARTELGVRPCVALLHAGDEDESGRGRASSSRTVEESLIPRLDAKEVAAVFSAPFHNFLRVGDEMSTAEERASVQSAGGKWYEGMWTEWYESRFRMHNFYVPIAGHAVTKAKEKGRGQRVAAEHLDKAERAGELSRYRVFGMTARIMVDAARIAYGEEPEFEHTMNAGDEELIVRLQKTGRLGEMRRKTDMVEKEDQVKVAKM